MNVASTAKAHLILVEAKGDGQRIKTGFIAVLVMYLKRTQFVANVVFVYHRFNYWCSLHSSMPSEQQTPDGGSVRDAVAGLPMH